MDDENRRKIKFLLELGDGETDEVIEYNLLSDLVERQQTIDDDDPDKLWTVKRITGHQGPLQSRDRRYKGSMWNLLIDWEDGTSTYEPLSVISKDDPITVAKYAFDNDLLETAGWKQLKHWTRREERFKRLVKQATLANERSAPTFMFGVQVPRGVKQAYEFDKKNGNRSWEMAMQTEIRQLHE
jgi:hypothetical protein